MTSVFVQQNKHKKILNSYIYYSWIVFT